MVVVVVVVAVVQQLYVIVVVVVAVYVSTNPSTPPNRTAGRPIPPTRQPRGPTARFNPLPE